jgi:hypothetical protein
MNENIDIPLSSINEPGNIWINEKTGQIRYSLGKNDPSKWVVPLSEYKVGNNRTDKAFIRMGQPVSVGVIEDLNPEAASSADPYIVPTNPGKYQWCIGIALEPGNFSDNGSNAIVRKVHILSHGQLEYRLDDNRPNVFQPPNENGKYTWTYNDVGKPVYVSNDPEDNDGQPGGLTLDIAHAYHNGANIISVGRLIDAPTNDPSSTSSQQSIIIEIQPSGDVRGMIDSTQFDVQLAPEPEQTFDNINSNFDRLFFVKILNYKDKITGIESPRGYIIYDDTLMTKDSSNTPVGAFLVKSIDGILNLSEYKNKSVLVHRLGILSGNFGFQKSDFGRELFLSNGFATPIGSASSYEYKVGIIIDENKVLIDCRYPKNIKKLEAIGTIKPAYMDLDSINPPGKIITDVGFIAVIPGIIHKISGVWPEDVQCPTVNFNSLLKLTMYTGIYEYSTSDTNPIWKEIDGNMTFDSIFSGYFRFKDVFYKTSDGKVISQIKYTEENSPEEMQYIWPEMMFEYTFYPGDVPQDFFGSNIKFNIDYLINLGYFIDGKGVNIENYDIIVKVLDVGNTKELGIEYNGDIIISPGFYTVPDGTSYKWCGYEWSLQKETSVTGDSWFLKMVTKPGAINQNDIGYIQSYDVWGFCFPIGSKINYNVQILVTVRRRPTQHHGLMLNQVLRENNPWFSHIHTDTGGENLVTQDSLFFGKNLSGDIIKTDFSSSFILRQKEKLSGIDVEFISSHEYHYSPYFENNNILRNTITKVIEKRSVDRVKNGAIYKDIEWIYDFKNHKVSLNSDFAVNLNFLPTTQDLLKPNEESYKFVILSGDYNEGRSKNNVSGLLPTARSSLKTLHEVPIGFLNYVNSEQIKDETMRIGTVQSQWNSNNSLEKYLPADFQREIYSPINGKYCSGTLYSYSGNLKANLEWSFITEEINMLFNPLVRDLDGKIKSGGDYQSIQTNVGLLNYAAKETQDRLLKLERAMFGIDAPTMPNGININLSSPLLQKLDSYSLNLRDEGIIRIIQDLFKNGLLVDKFYDQDPVFKLDRNISYFNDIFLEIFGKYESKDEWETNISGLQFNKNGKVHIVYNWAKNKMDWERDGIKNIFFNNSNQLENENILIKPANDTARNIYMYKSHQGYNFDDESRLEPFYWPAHQNPATKQVWKGPLPDDRWWNNKVFGLNDIYFKSNGRQGSVPYPFTDYKGYYSFSTQSVEGILFDVIMKLSYLKEQSEDIDKSLKSDFTFIGKRYVAKEVQVGQLSFNLEAPKNNQKFFFTDEFFGNTLKGEYTSFGFKDDKIITAWHTDIAPKYFPENYSNQDFKFNKFEFVTHNQDLYDDLVYIYRVSGINPTDSNQVNENLPDFEYHNNLFPDNIIQYKIESSGLSFDKTAKSPFGVNGAEDINTKFVVEISGITNTINNFTVDSPGDHQYVVSYFGKYVTNIKYIPAEHHSPMFWPGRLPSLTGRRLPTLTGRVLPSHPGISLPGIIPLVFPGPRTSPTRKVNNYVIDGTRKVIDQPEIPATVFPPFAGQEEISHIEWDIRGKGWVKTNTIPDFYNDEWDNANKEYVNDSLKTFSSGTFNPGSLGTFYEGDLGVFDPGTSDIIICKISGDISGYVSGFRHTNLWGGSDYSGMLSGIISGITMDGDLVSGLVSGVAFGQVYSTNLTNGPFGLQPSGYIAGYLQNIEYEYKPYIPAKLTYETEETWIVEDHYISDSDKTRKRVKTYIEHIDPVGVSGVAPNIKYGLLYNKTNIVSGIIEKQNIKDFHLYGSHIPEEYIMLTKIRAHEHVSNQIHLVLSDGPQIYPKIINNKNTSQVQYFGLTSVGKFIMFWNPGNYLGQFLLYEKIYPEPEDQPNYYVWLNRGTTKYNVCMLTRKTAREEVNFRVFYDSVPANIIHESYPGLPAGDTPAVDVIFEEDEHLLQDFMIGDTTLISLTDPGYYTVPDFMQQNFNFLIIDV